MCSQTVGVLTVVAASVSGVYRCVASNAAGSDQLDHHFYVSGEARFVRRGGLFETHLFRTNEWKQEEAVEAFKTGEVRRTG